MQLCTLEPMSPPVQTSDHAVFASRDQLRSRPSESYAEGVYWADLPAAKRTRWMLQQQVCIRRKLVLRNARQVQGCMLKQNKISDITPAMLQWEEESKEAAAVWTVFKQVQHACQANTCAGKLDCYQTLHCILRRCSITHLASYSHSHASCLIDLNAAPQMKPHAV